MVVVVVAVVVVVVNFSGSSGGSSGSSGDSSLSCSRLLSNLWIRLQCPVENGRQGID